MATLDCHALRRRKICITRSTLNGAISQMNQVRRKRSCDKLTVDLQLPGVLEGGLGERGIPGATHELRALVQHVGREGERGEGDVAVRGRLVRDALADLKEKQRKVENVGTTNGVEICRKLVLVVNYR